MVLVYSGSDSENGIVVRALLDGGSQGSLITSNLAGRLGLSLEPTRDRLRGIGEVEPIGPSGKGWVTFSPVGQPFPKITTPVVCMETIIGNQPTFRLSDSVVHLTSDLPLADPNFYLPKPIELLLGSDVFGSLVGGEKISIRGLTAYQSVFGYVLLGPVEAYSADSGEVDSDFFGVSVSDTLQKFWEVEELPPTVQAAPSDEECERFYKNNTVRLEDGKFMTKLPFVASRPVLGDSRVMAEKRFLALERRLRMKPILREKYIEFIREYIRLGHMSVSDFNFNSGQEYYIIPHHAVCKDESSKLRVVFDGSSVTSSGVSLNQCLHAGPKLHRDITEILMHFRKPQIVFVTDIKMMFRQTWIDPSDRRFQWILWRESPQEPLVLYELNTNTYGLKSSPYLAIRTLLELADRERERFPRAAAIMEQQVYVDDILTGADTEEDAILLRQELIWFMRTAGYELRKWISNCPSVLSGLPEDHLQVPHLFDNPEAGNMVSVLGIQYNPIADVFSYQTTIASEGAVTKRVILSTVARMYDPSGWICPVTFWAKCFLQKLWLQELAWDEEVSGDLKRDWTRFKDDLPNVRQVRVPRCMYPKPTDRISVHGFSDASESGYAAVVYLHTCDSHGASSVHLVMAKSKVAPIRSRLTIPKLELCGAVLLTKLLHHVCLCLQKTMDISEIYGWTDSSIVCCWIKTAPHTLQVFEANRVSQIQNASIPIQWRHVPGQVNPADCASRGCAASDLLSHPLWWGPKWLQEPASRWPASEVLTPAALPGLRCLAVASVDEPDSSDSEFLEKYSSLDELIGVVGWLRRFIHNCRNNHDRITSDYLSAEERRESLLACITMVQARHFGSELDRLRTRQRLVGHWKRLNPFVDSRGLLRVGGRLQNSDLPYDARHPLVLPKSDHFVTILIRDLHVKNAHVGPNTLLGLLQRHYWVLSARRAVNKVTSKCIPCYKLKAPTAQPLMGNLPRDRVVAARPFQGVGTDFAGPFLVKSHKLRKPKITKAYLCVLVCLATKSVHLEVVSELSTEAFIAALSRFVSRRGLPSLIRSDCGTNFKGANNYLQGVLTFLTEDQAVIGQELARRGITWVFDPPACPSWGGLFEAAVKSAKTHLKRVIGETILTYEELSTVFCKIEAVLNSRPLCPLSSDPNDLEILTPGHFLIGQPLNAVPEYPLQEEKLHRLTRFQLLQQISQRVWHRWQLEYLHTLQQRVKWTDSSVPPKVGDLVLLKEDNAPPLHWRRGRIVALYPGKDEVIRVADVKLAQGTVLQRAVAKLSRLPIE